MANFENNLDAYNAVELALGGLGAQPNDIVVVRAIAVLEGVSGGPASITEDNMILRLNAIDVGAGGPGDHLNTLDALNSIVVLKGGLGGHENDLDAINEWVDVALVYLLRAPFDADDQSFIDTQVLNTPAEGVTAGQLTVALPAGTLGITSNRCVFTAGNNQLLSSQSITKVLGRTLIFTAQVDSAVTNTRIIGWTDVASAAIGDAILTMGFTDSGNVQCISQGVIFRNVMAYSASTDYAFALTLGGYDTNGVAFTSGDTPADFLFGASLYVKGGTFTTWTLLWKDSTDDIATLFSVWSNESAAGQLEDFRVADRDLSAVLLPSALSTFNAPNGTSLDAIDPEVGPAWTEQSGVWDIQSNRANPDGAAIATVATGEADAVIDLTVNAGTTDNPALVLRLTDLSNNWYLQADRVNDLLELHEVEATVDTIRASTAVTINASTDYDLRAVPDDETIDGYLDGANKISYASATLNKTASNHGLRAETATGQFDNFAVFARTTAIYDTEFDAV